MATKKYDLAIKTGEYESNGQTKSRFKNIGVIFEGDKGPYLLLDATVISTQLFALVNKERRESVIVSMFAPKDSSTSTAKPAQADSAPLDDDIPF